ncbi:hypothetical protein BC826DRAFT_991170 [Russula brevipes]|nr:hypothetical protein BC826DRAFT_991170 [Russula brevipes]
MSRNTSATAPLCLACSSSLPPRLWKQTQEDAQRGSTSAGGGGSDTARRPSSELFLTRCCGRPICPSCLISNPRLARYDPCLACLGGVGAVDSAENARGQHIVVSNIDGAVRDEDVFVVGDEDEDEDSEMHDVAVAKAPSTILLVAKPPERNASTGTNTSVRLDPNKSEELSDGDHGSPGRYYIQPEDTLLGISLRLGVDGRALCKLNDLPPSSLRTTPHLLHTRTFLDLPQSRSQQYATGDASPEEEARRRREHAQVAFQHVTKETDHGIAQA